MTAEQLSAIRHIGPVSIVPVLPGDVPAVLALVESVDLPIAGIEAALEYFWGAWEGEQLIGTVGLEVYADVALLRSLAVAPWRQGSGLGQALVETVFAYLTARRFRAVFLLTTTAEAFFLRYGFVRVARIEVPASVQQSIEFQEACPDTAACLYRTWSHTENAASQACNIRPARFPDLPAVRSIRNQGIEDRVATLDDAPHTPDEIAAWFQRHGPRHPVLVAERAGRVVGWASLNQFNPRRAYQYVADLSVYIERPWRGQGLGSQLLETVIACGQQLGYHKIVLSAFPFNSAGMRLYERYGFRTVGIYKEMGLVDGQWVDTIIMEKMLENSNLLPP